MSNETTKKSQGFWKSLVDSVKSCFGGKKSKVETQKIGPAIKLEPIKTGTPTTKSSIPEEKEELREIKIQEERKPFYQLKPLVLGSPDLPSNKKIEKVETPKKSSETKQDQQPPKKTSVSEGPSSQSTNKSASSAKKSSPKKKK